MSDTSLNRYVAQGDDAAEAGFTPDPVTGTTPEQAVLFVNSEDPVNPELKWWDGANFIAVTGGGGGNVNAGGTLANNALVIGQGSTDVATTTTGSGVLTFLGTPSSANLRSALTDETGTGAAVFADTPTLVTPVLGTPTSGTLTNCSGLPGATGITGTIPSSNLGTAVKTRAITFAIDGGGSALTTGIKADVYVPYACTITAVTMLADQSGSVVVDIWGDPLANYPPTDADSITASAPPTISSATNSQDTTLTGWTTAIAAGDTLRFNIDSASTITRLSLTLTVTV